MKLMLRQITLAFELLFQVVGEWNVEDLGFVETHTQLIQKYNSFPRPPPPNLTMHTVPGLDKLDKHFSSHTLSLTLTNTHSLLHVQYLAHQL